MELSPEIIKKRVELAKRVHDAYFDGEEINGISPQCPDDAAIIGFDAACELLLPKIEGIEACRNDILKDRTILEAKLAIAVAALKEIAKYATSATDCAEHAEMVLKDLGAWDETK